MIRTGDDERGDVLAFLDRAASLDDVVYEAAGAKSPEEILGARRSLRAARNTIAQGGHVGAAARGAAAAAKRVMS